MMRPMHGLAIMLAALAPSWAAAVPLPREAIIQRALAQAPDVQVAQARVLEAQALHVGAGALALTNPDATLSAGPHYIDHQRPTTEVTLKFTWPLDMVNTHGARTEAADAAERLALDELRAVQRVAVADAIGAAIRVRWAAARMALLKQRAELDQDFLRAARVRRETGTVGDGDVALAQVLAAESFANFRQATAQHDAVQFKLRQVLGLPHDTPLDLVDEDVPPLALDTALAKLHTRADLQRNRTQITRNQREALLQKRTGIPQPRLQLDGGRMPEWFVEGGINVALPLYQYNQTNHAVAAARVTVAETIAHTQDSVAEAEVRAAHATYDGALQAFASLQSAAPAMDDAAHLASRAYELGQSMLSQVVVTRRETLTARLALVDATWAVAEARLNLELAAGMLP